MILPQFVAFIQGIGVRNTRYSTPRGTQDGEVRCMVWECWGQQRWGQKTIQISRVNSYSTAEPIAARLTHLAPSLDLFAVGPLMTPIQGALVDNHKISFSNYTYL